MTPVALFVVLAAALGCAGPGIRHAAGPPAVIRIDGSAGVMPLVAALAEEYRALEPSVSIVLGSGMASPARVDALTQGRIDVAMASHGIIPADLAMRSIAVHEIARVAVVFAAHESVPVTGLSRAQICAIYSGAVTRWSAVGGPDREIVARTRPAGEVDADVARAGIGCLGSALAASTARSIEAPGAMAADLAATPYAIGMTSMPFVLRSDGRLRALALDGVSPTAESVSRGTYALARASYLLTRKARVPAVDRFLAFIRSAAGARVITANGGIPVA